jgi:hypothetical protein
MLLMMLVMPQMGSFMSHLMENGLTSLSNVLGQLQPTGR